MLLCCLRRNVDWLLIMNTSSSSPIKSKCCRLAATSVNNFPRFVTACIAQHSMEPYIAWELPASSAFNAPYTAVPAEGYGDYQTLICVLVARPRRCLTLSNPVPWQNWMAAYLGYTLRMRTLFCDWPIMVNDTHTRRKRMPRKGWSPS